MKRSASMPRAIFWAAYDPFAALVQRDMRLAFRAARRQSRGAFFALVSALCRVWRRRGIWF